MTWKQTTKEIEGKVGDIIDVIFTYEGKESIKDISTSCGCVGTVFDIPFLKCKISLPKKHPAILESTFFVDRHIYVTYQDDTMETLLIKTIVHE